MTTISAGIRYVTVTKFTDDTDRRISGSLVTIDSKGQNVLLIFVVDMGMETIEIALSENNNTYPAFNDRILDDDAPESDLGYVMVEPIYTHNVVTEVQASEHWWTEADFKALEKDVLDHVYRRWERATEAAKAEFSRVMLGARF